MAASDTTSSRTPHLTGGCQCGAVRYAFYAPPMRIGVCHCRMCQKAVGGPFGVFAVVGAKDFAWTRGGPSSWASSSISKRDFCSTCGTPLGIRDNSGADVEILTGTFDQPERVAPTYEVGVEGKLGWLKDLTSLPGKTTDQSRRGQPQIESRQHPDHDT